MKINIADIYEGWKNHLFPTEKLKETINKVSRSRRRICNECEYHSKHYSSIRFDIHCTICGCTLSAKTKCLSCVCPLDPPKWNDVLTDEQEKQIENETEEFDITKNMAP
jgi:hypothetical protein